MCVTEQSGRQMIPAGQKSSDSGQRWQHAGSVHTLIKIAGFLLAAVLVWLLIRAADWRAMARELRNSNIYLLLCTLIFVGGSSWLLRAARWRLLLVAEEKVGFWTVFWANNAGSLGNVLLPARTGEFIRSAMVGAGCGLTQRFVLATAACERIIDLLVFVTLAEVVIWYGPGIPGPILQAINLAFLIAVAGIIALLAASHFERLVDSVIARLLRRPRMADRINKYLEPVIDGVRTIHGWKQMTGFIGLSLLIWLLDVSGAMFVAYAMGFTLSFPVAFILTAGLVFINLVPATPGQLGVYQWVVVRVLAIPHIDYNKSLAYSLVMQASSYFALLLLGVPGLILYRKSRPQGEKFTNIALKEMKSAPE